MRIPERLVSLVEDGLLDEVVRPLMSGKEAQVYLVMAGGEERVAKVYKESAQRSFKHRAEYTEGRKTRNSRDQRAMGRRSKHGRAHDEMSWQTAEVDMIYRLQEAGVRVPVPYSFMDGVLIMELITDGEGNPAPQLGTVELGRKEALAIYDALLQEVVRMLCAGVIHGDLSDFNVLLGADGPVVIDFPQAVDSANNPSARKLLMRDVSNLNRFVAKFVTGLRRLPYAEEMWELYEKGKLTPDTKLEGKFTAPKQPADVDAVLREIDIADREEQERRDAYNDDPRDLLGRGRSRQPSPRRDRSDGKRDATPGARGGRTPAPPSNRDDRPGTERPGTERPTPADTGRSGRDRPSAPRDANRPAARGRSDGPRSSGGDSSRRRDDGSGRGNSAPSRGRSDGPRSSGGDSSRRRDDSAGRGNSAPSRGRSDGPRSSGGDSSRRRDDSAGRGNSSPSRGRSDGPRSSGGDSSRRRDDGSGRGNSAPSRGRSDGPRSSGGDSSRRRDDGAGRGNPPPSRRREEGPTGSQSTSRRRPDRPRTSTGGSTGDGGDERSGSAPRRRRRRRGGGNRGAPKTDD